MSELGGSQVHDAEFKLASSLVQDGVTRVTVVVPRGPGVLVRARVLAEQAGVEASAGKISGETITIRFSGSQAAPVATPSLPPESIGRRLAAAYTWLRGCLVAPLGKVR
jgi:hypothetical protein